MATPSPALLNTQRGQSLVWVQHTAGTGAAWVLWVPGLAPALRRPSSAQLRGPGPIPLLRLPPSLPCPGGVPGQDKPLPAALSAGGMEALRGRVCPHAARAPPCPFVPGPCLRRAGWHRRRRCHMLPFPAAPCPLVCSPCEDGTSPRQCRKGCCTPKDPTPLWGTPKGFPVRVRRRGCPGQAPGGAQDRVLWVLVGFGCRRALGACSPSCQPSASVGSARGGWSPRGG